MTKYLILLAILIALYLAWKHQQNKILPHNPDDIIERKGKAKSETFWDANDWEINSDNEDNTLKCPSAEFVPANKKSHPFHKQQRQLKKKK